jgi:integrase
MAITTGARRGELLALTWAQIDWKRSVARVQLTKNGEPKMLPLVPAVLAELERFRKKRDRTLVFGSKRRPDVAYNFDSAWAGALRRARIERFRFHDLRHTCASYLAQQGASLLEIADVMGHRQLAMVKRYAHLTTDTKARLVNRVLGGIK